MVRQWFVLMLISCLLFAACLKESDLTEKMARSTVDALLEMGEDLPGNCCPPARLVEWHGLLIISDTERHARVTIDHSDGRMTGSFVFHKTSAGEWALDMVAFKSGFTSWWNESVFLKVGEKSRTKLNLPGIGKHPAKQEQPSIRDNEAGMVGILRAMAAGQTDYNNNSQPHTYTKSLACLASGNGAGGVSFIDPTLASGQKNGYNFAMHAGVGFVHPNKPTTSLWAWSATAWPIVYGSTGVRTGYIDESGVVRAMDNQGQPGDYRMPAIN